MKELTAREMVKMLLERGWIEMTQVESHRKFRHPSDSRLRVVVPMHSGALTVGVQKSIMRVAGISRDEL